MPKGSRPVKRCFSHDVVRLGLLGACILFGAVSGAAGQASPSTTTPDQDATSWPREAKFPKATILMYQPQIERLTENDIEARAAVQVTLDGAEPAFGAVWITARVDVDRDARVVSFDDIRIPRVRFVDASDAQKADLARVLEQVMPTWDLEMSLDEFIPLLELADHEDPRDVGLKHAPPRIIVASEPTTLVVIDGTPRRQAVTTPAEAAQERIERVVNTPVLVAYHPGRKTYYLAGGGDLWYSATDVMGPYGVVTDVPRGVRALAPPAEAGDAVTDGQPPRMVVATEPTEVIVVAGEPQYAPMGDVDLLAVSNADTDIIVTMASRAHYVLLSGRWYVSQQGLAGPWTFVPPGELPVDFAKIPEDSEHAHVRAHVPGTIEAQEALLDNTIPETQAIRRDDHSLKVEYDGAPVFEDVEGATLQYAVNTPQAVFKLGSRYFVCESGVWYESTSATGPWSVAAEVPAVIYDIPASNPHHNVTYVKVYEVTPQVVYVGYTPGYLGSYPYGGCVVYGTGWYYPGWYGAVYYPRPVTWGFRAVYSPYYGWGFGIGWSSGPLTVSIGWGVWHPGWWGPWGYRPYYPPYRPPYYPGYRPPYYPGYRPPKLPRVPAAGGTSADRHATAGHASPTAGERRSSRRPAARQQPLPPGRQGAAQCARACDQGLREADAIDAPERRVHGLRGRRVPAHPVGRLGASRWRRLEAEPRCRRHSLDPSDPTEHPSDAAEHAADAANHAAGWRSEPGLRRPAARGEPERRRRGASAVGTMGRRAQRKGVVMNLADCVALVTGGGSGIGLATARHLRQHGARVAVCGRRREPLEEAARAIGAMPIVGDVSREEDAVRIVRTVIEEFGDYNTLINNAGWGRFTPLVDLTVDEFRAIHDTNVIGAMLMARESAKHFIARGGGHIVNVSSTAGSKGFAGGTAYASSKFALGGMTECWRAELRGHDIRVMQINPSEVQTEFFAAAGAERKPSDRKLRGEEIAHAIGAMLSMDDRGFTTELTVFATNPD